MAKNNESVKLNKARNALLLELLSTITIISTVKEFIEVYNKQFPLEKFETNITSEFLKDLLIIIALISQSPDEICDSDKAFIELTTFVDCNDDPDIYRKIRPQLPDAINNFTQFTSIRCLEEFVGKYLKRCTSEQKEIIRDISNKCLELRKNIVAYYEHVGNLYIECYGTSEEKQQQFSRIIAKSKLQLLENDIDKISDSIQSKSVQENLDSKGLSGLSELRKLIGLEDIKKDIEELISLVKIQQIRKKRGLPHVPVSLHLVFTGNPGTGKTSVARIIAKLYKEIGLLKSGQLVEVDRADLVAGYIGQTAIKTQEVIDRAIGGILFIDEAYTLVKDGNDFGQEAIDTILKAMEDRRDEFVVIVAGYREPMQKFINSNPGLKSRFNKYFDFQDYSYDELLDIFELLADKYEYDFTHEARIYVRKAIRDMKIAANENFANAREVRNYFEHIVSKQALRVSQCTNPSDKELTLVEKCDVIF